MTIVITDFGRSYIDFGYNHSNKMNKFLHTIGVPLVVASFLAMVALIPFKFKVFGIKIGCGDIVGIIALIYALTINIAYSIGMMLLAFLMRVAWKLAFVRFYGFSYFKWLVILNLIGWALQVIGHSVFQKKKLVFEGFISFANIYLFIVILIFDLLGIRSAQLMEWNRQIENNQPKPEKAQEREQ